MVINIILAILVLSIIIIIHEFGHFIVAKANGITVVEFSLGFGPKLIHFKKGETEYSLKLLPFGGACIMLGEDFLEADDDEQEDATEDNNTGKSGSELDNDFCNGKTAEDNGFGNASRYSSDNTSAGSYMSEKKKQEALEAGYDMSKSFANKSVWARIAVIAAGPIFNFILAFVCSVVIIGSIGYDPCMVDVVYDNSPAVSAGLQEGDKIIKVNNQKITFYRDYSFYRVYHADDTMNITYERDGQKYTTTLTPEYVKQQKYQMGVTLEQNGTIAGVSDGTPAQKAGIKKGDIITAVNGVAVDGSTKIIELVGQCNGESVDITINRDGNTMQLNVTPDSVENEYYYTGFASYGARQKVSPISVIGYAFKEVGYSVNTVVKSLGMMFTGQVGINDLSGPVGTVSAMSNIVEESKADGTFYVILNLLNLAGLISANLGVMNLLPIPALDGGRLVFLILEVLRGKPVKKEHEGMVHFVGMIFLFVLMIYVMFKDIRGLF